MKKGKILGLEFEEEDEGALFCHIWLMKKQKIEAQAEVQRRR